MIYPESTEPTPGITPITSDLASGNAALVAEWQQLARPTFRQPDYAPVPSLQEYLAEEEPKMMEREQSGRPMRSRHQRRLHQAAAGYSEFVNETTAHNTELHGQWYSDHVPVLSELCGLAIIAGDDEAAQHYAALAREYGADIGQSDKIGLAFVAHGQHEQGKTILLGRRDDSIKRAHAHRLLDAYTWTGDPEYRAHLLTVLPQAQFLVARLAKLDISQGRPIDDLFDVSKETSGARLVLALTVTASEHDDTGRFDRYLQATLAGLRAPERKTVMPPPPPTKSEKLRRRIRQDGLFGLMEDAMEKGFDLLDGTGHSESKTPQKPRPQFSPEYREFLKDVVPILRRTNPWLAEHPDYVNEGYGDLNHFTGETAHAILLARANAGHNAAAIHLLEGGANQYYKSFAYCNLLHSLGSAAAYLPRLEGTNRRIATYYTLVTAAARGATIPAPEAPDLRDDFCQLQALYNHITQAVAKQSKPADSLPLDYLALATEAQLTDLRLLNNEGTEAILTRIRALNDPEAERAALQELAARLKDRGNA